MIKELQQRISRVKTTMRLSFLLLLLPACVESFIPSRQAETRSTSSSAVLYYERVTYPESQAATYEMSKVFVPFEFGSAATVRPLLKQTQLENRRLKVVYDAKKHGWNAKTFHQKVDGKGAAVVLARAGFHQFGGYNPRGWASLGGSRPSIASFLFYKTLFGWQKLRVKGNGGAACSRDEWDMGIYFGAEGLTVPLNGQDPRAVASRLGTYFDLGPDGRTTLLSRPGGNPRLDDLQVLTGVYAPGESIPNSGGVTDLGLY
jgi:hypothetical protein